MLPGGQAQLAGFPHVVGQRLLRVDVLADLDRHHGGDGVGVIGRGDGDGVDLLAHLVEHLAEVGELSGLGVLGGFGVEALLVDVADGDEVGVLGGLLAVAVAFAADADAGEVDPLVGGFAGKFVGPGLAAGNPNAGAGEYCSFKE